MGEANLYLRAAILVCVRQICAQQRKYGRRKFIYKRGANLIRAQQIYIRGKANLYMCAPVIQHGHTPQHFVPVSSTGIPLWLKRGACEWLWDSCFCSLATMPHAICPHVTLSIHTLRYLSTRYAIYLSTG